jgi:hypothetical protein
MHGYIVKKSKRQKASNHAGWRTKTGKNAGVKSDLSRTDWPALDRVATDGIRRIEAHRDRIKRAYLQADYLHARIASIAWVSGPHSSLATCPWR